MVRICCGGLTKPYVASYNFTSFIAIYHNILFTSYVIIYFWPVYVVFWMIRGERGMLGWGLVGMGFRIVGWKWVISIISLMFKTYLCMINAWIHYVESNDWFLPALNLAQLKARNVEPRGVGNGKNSYLNVSQITKCK